MMVNLSIMCGEEGCGDLREERGVRSKILSLLAGFLRLLGESRSMFRDILPLLPLQP
ncbi:MAG: hypothetical protein QCI82_08460 [Candidatus Thermoplasmatota archaeon]|nr:hypothetical protein [Candidatus Thermoplasmatota archaeon]